MKILFYNPTYIPDGQIQPGQEKLIMASLTHWLATFQKCKIASFPLDNMVDKNQISNFNQWKIKIILFSSV